jgi:hypothetical protein
MRDVKLSFRATRRDAVKLAAMAKAGNTSQSTILCRLIRGARDPTRPMPGPRSADDAMALVREAAGEGDMAAMRMLRDEQRLADGADEVARLNALTRG